MKLDELRPLHGKLVNISYRAQGKVKAKTFQKQVLLRILDDSVYIENELIEVGKIKNCYSTFITVNGMYLCTETLNILQTKELNSVQDIVSVCRGSITSASKRLGVTRNTIRKYLTSKDEAFIHMGKLFTQQYTSSLKDN